MSSGKRPKPEREICRIETFQDIAALSVQEAHFSIIGRQRMQRPFHLCRREKLLPVMHLLFRRWGSLPASLQYDFNFPGYTGIDKQPVKLYSVAFNKDILVHELARAALSMSV